MNMLLVDSRQDDSWLDELARHLPDFDVRSSVDNIDLAAVTHVAMWRLPVEQLAAMANLEAICMMGAGFDHLELDALPDVPIVRLVDPAMANDIALYVLSWAVHFQREFDQFFTDCDLVVDLVPLSAATRGVIGAAELRALGDGVLINVGRGATIDTDALLEALDGQLRAAVLDVFEIEPLPADSPLWSHDKVTVTPHIAGRSDPVTAAPIIAASIAELRSGALPATTVSR